MKEKNTRRILVLKNDMRNRADGGKGRADAEQQL